MPKSTLKSLPAYLGIDVAKLSLQVCLQRGTTTQQGSFDNSPAGFTKLDHWLKKRQVGHVHACLEATGRYGEAVAEHLHAAGHTVSVLNPAQVKYYRRSTLTRAKTDAVDAALLAAYGQERQPAAWSPRPPAARQLRELVRRRAALLEMRQQERNRLASGELPPTVVGSLQAVETVLTQEIDQMEDAMDATVQADPPLARQHALLLSIPGIGQLTANTLLGEIDFRAFPSARHLAAYAGLTPEPHESGTSGHGQTHLSPHGAGQIRHALYFPAVSALRCNPLIRVFVERLTERGKLKMVIIGAVMRKMLHLCYGILRSGQPFDPNYPSQPTPSAQPVRQTAPVEAV
jgi:transposase